jgi:hypothetical protein
MVAAGAQPITSVQYLLELQRDWTRTETYELTLDIARQFGGPTASASSTPGPWSERDPTTNRCAPLRLCQEIR